MPARHRPEPPERKSDWGRRTFINLVAQALKNNPKFEKEGLPRKNTTLVDGEEWHRYDERGDKLISPIILLDLLKKEYWSGIERELKYLVLTLCAMRASEDLEEPIDEEREAQNIEGLDPFWEIIGPPPGENGEVLISVCRLCIWLMEHSRRIF
jgi:hypothetical protein